MVGHFIDLDIMCIYESVCSIFAEWQLALKVRSLEINYTVKLALN